MNYIVEFTGIPGAGKTYLCEKMFERLQKEYPDRGLYDRKTVYLERNEHGIKQLFSVFSLAFVPVYLKLFATILFGKSFSGERRVKLKYIIKILLQQQFVLKQLKKRDDCFFLLDEGFVHLQYIFLERTGDASFREKQKKILISLLNRYGDSKRIVLFVDCDLNDAFNRIEIRQQGWPVCFLGQSKEDKHNYLINQKKVYDYLQGTLEATCIYTLKSSDVDSAMGFLKKECDSKRVIM